jgi:hypothetical protein
VPTWRTRNENEGTLPGRRRSVRRARRVADPSNNKRLTERQLTPNKFAEQRQATKPEKKALFLV